MLGLHFENCNEFLLAVNFENCTLDLSIFYGRKMKNTPFINCSLKEVDFSDVDLSGAKFDQCDFHRTVFENTNLERTDFSTSYNFIINPDVHNIKKAVFSLNGLPGLLMKYELVVS